MNDIIGGIIDDTINDDINDSISDTINAICAADPSFLRRKCCSSRFRCITTSFDD